MFDFTTRHSSEVKTCTKCKQEKPLTAFSRNRSKADGLQSWCKACEAEKWRAWREANPARAKATARAWRKANRDKDAATAARLRARYPARHAARGAVSTAIRRGKIAPARDFTCTMCGAPAQQYHHHLGYAREHRLDIVPVCMTCHTELHSDE